MKKNILYIALLIIVLVSCQSKENETQEKVSYSKEKKEKEDETIAINRNMLSVNRDMIEKYISRHKWDMTETESGLYYMIYSKTDDVKVESGCMVEFSFKVSLLNGDVIYDSDATGNRKMMIDKNQEEAGLNEGLKLMRKGEMAYFILPPHLAFSVPGDSYKIPPYSIIVYDIEVVNVVMPENDEIGDVVL